MSAAENRRAPAQSAPGGIVGGFDNVAYATALSALTLTGTLSGGGSWAGALFLASALPAALVLAAGFLAATRSPIVVIIPARRSGRTKKLPGDQP